MTDVDPIEIDEPDLTDDFEPSPELDMNDGVEMVANAVTDKNEEGNDDVMITEVKDASPSRLKQESNAEHKEENAEEDFPEMQAEEEKPVSKPDKPQKSASSNNSPQKRPPLMNPSKITDSQRASRKTSQGGSITNFDPKQPVHLTEKWTCLAMHKLGITDKDLQYPDELTLNTYSKNAKIKEFARKNMQDQVDALIIQVKDLRQQLIDEEKSDKNQSETTSSGKETSIMALEQERYNRMSKRHKRDVEQMLMNILIQQETAEEERLREIKEQERQKQKEEQIKQKAQEDALKQKKKLEEQRERELEQQRKEEELRQQAFEKEMKAKQKQEEEKERKRREAQEEERKREEKMRATKEHLQMLEENRRKEAEERQRKAQEREEQRLKAQEDEAQRRSQIRQQLQELREAQYKKVLEDQQNQSEQRMRNAAIREQKMKDNLKHYEEQRQKQIQEQQERDKQKQMQFMAARERKEREMRERAEKITKANEEANKRYRDLENQKKQKMMDASRGYDQQSLKIKAKISQIRSDQDAKNEAALEAMAKADERRQQIRDEQLFQRSQKAVEARLMREQKAAMAVRAEKRRMAEKQAAREVLDARLKKIEENQQNKERMREASRKRVYALERKKESLVEQAENLKVGNSTAEPTQMRQLAEAFDIDINELKARIAAKKHKQSQSAIADKPKNRSSLPPLNPDAKRTPSGDNDIVVNDEI